MKKVIVTGASGSIGSAISMHLASRGYDLILASRNEKGLNNLKGSIEEQTGRLTQILPMDYSDTPPTKSNLDEIKKLEGLILITPRPEVQNDLFPHSQE